MPVPPGPNATNALAREAERGRERDQALARNLKNVSDDADDALSIARKNRADVARLSQLSMISLLLQPKPVPVTKGLKIQQPGGGLAAGAGDQLAFVEPGKGDVDVVTGINTPSPILPALVLMMMTRGIGRTGSGGGAFGGDNAMFPILILLLAGGGSLGGTTTTTGSTTTTSGGLDTTTLLLVLLATGSMG